MNVFGCAALEAAYNHSQEWLDALRAYLYDNYLTVKQFLQEELPAVTAPPLEGTYLMWLDCRGARGAGEPLKGFSERFANHLRDSEKLVLSTGTIYGEGAEGWERLNIACPRARLLDGLQRFKHGFLSYRYA